MVLLEPTLLQMLLEILEILEIMKMLEMLEGLLVMAVRDLELICGEILVGIEGVLSLEMQ